jgi:hypothetical protein
VIGDSSAETAETAETSSANKGCSNIKRLGSRRRTASGPAQTAQTAETPVRVSLLIGISLAETAETPLAVHIRSRANGRRKGRNPGVRPPSLPRLAPNSPYAGAKEFPFAAARPCATLSRVRAVARATKSGTTALLADVSTPRRHYMVMALRMILPSFRGA